MGITRADTSADRYKTVHHPFAARLFEFDLKLIAFDLRDFAITEFLVKDAQADAEVTATFIAKADRAACVFRYALWARVKSAGCGCPLPARATRIAAALVGGRQMRERVRLFAPVGTPK